MKIMPIYTHPADVITDCGGTLALHVSHGDEVVALVVTHGGRIHPNKYEEEWRKENPDESILHAGRETLIQSKKEEFLQAAAIIGIHRSILLDYDDDFMTPQPETIDKIARQIAAERPDAVLMDYPAGGAFYGQHEMCSSMIFTALVRAAEFTRNLDGVEPHSVPQIFYTKIPVTNRSMVGLGGLKTDLYIDITPVYERKMRAMDAFESQGYGGDFARKFVEAHDGERGRSAGVCFAENFMRHYTETHSLLPVTEAALQRDALMNHRQYSVLSTRSVKLKGDK